VIPFAQVLVVVALFVLRTNLSFRLAMASRSVFVETALFVMESAIILLLRAVLFLILIVSLLLFATIKPSIRVWLPQQRPTVNVHL